MLNPNNTLDHFIQINQRVTNVTRKNVFFIIGVLKSGTTWLQSLLNGHPDICCKGESHVPNLFIPNLLKVMEQHNKVIVAKNKMLNQEQNGYPTFSRDDVYYLAKSAFCLLLSNQAGGRDYSFIGEKTPDNIRYLDILSRHLFPQAKFVHIIRDGRDCAVSGWHHIYRDSHDWAKENFPTFDKYAGFFAKQWVREIHLARDFGQHYPDRYLEIRYETLHTEPKETTEVILHFLGADTSRSSVDTCLAAGSFEKLSQGRKVGVEDRNSHFRKGSVGDWEEFFDERSLMLFNKTTGTLLEKLGYTRKVI